LEITDNILEIV